MHYEKLGRHLKLMVPKYRPDPVSRLEDISEKVYSTELKPIVITQKHAQLHIEKLIEIETTPVALPLVSDLAWGFVHF